MTTNLQPVDVEALMSLVHFAVGPYPQPGGTTYQEAVAAIESALRKLVTERNGLATSLMWHHLKDGKVGTPQVCLTCDREYTFTVVDAAALATKEGGS